MMEKYGQTQNDMLADMRMQEDQLMRKISALMQKSEKTASETGQLSAAESQLANLRARITEIDLMKK